MKIFRCAVCLYLLIFLHVVSAFGQEEVKDKSKEQKHEITLGLGGTASSTPYKNYSTQWAGYPVISYEGSYAYIRGFRAGFKLINVDFLETSIYGGYDPREFNPANSSNVAIRQLDKRHSSAVAGGQVILKTPYGMLHSSVEGDVLGHSNGLSGEFGYMKSFDIGQLEIIPAIGAFWSNDKYNSYYYGISSREANQSGLRKYTSGSSISPRVGLTLDYSLTDNLEVYWNGQVTFLDSTIKNSPMVGRDATSSTSIGLAYTFDVN